MELFSAVSGAFFGISDNLDFGVSVIPESVTGSLSES